MATDRVVTLTPALLRRIVLEEKSKIIAEAKKKKKKLKETEASLTPLATAEEVEASDLANSLANKKEHGPSEARERYNQLTLQERKISKILEQIRESKRVIRSRLVRK